VRIAKFHVVFSALLLLVSLPYLFAQSNPQVRGVVSDPVGGFVSDASVTLFSLEKVREVRTDRLGQFAFVDLPQGIYELKVKSPGFKTASLGNINVSDVPAPQVSTTLQLESPGCGDFQPTASYPERSGEVNLTGTVKDYSAGFVKNAKLTLTLSGSNRGQPANTNENGEFQFTDLAPGKYTMKVRQAGYFEASVTEFSVTPKNLTTLTPIYVFRKRRHSIIICQ
jgi:carboxypeptidase family protein